MSEPPGTAPFPVFVVGYGNPMRGDDGVGQEVARALEVQAGEPGLLSQAVVTWAHQLVPEMCEDLRHAELAVFVDAGRDHRSPGSVTLSHVVAPGGSSPPPSPGFSGCWQDMAPGDLLGLCWELFGSSPPGMLVTVSVASTGAGFGLSAPVEAAVPLAAAAVRLVIAGYHPLLRQTGAAAGAPWGGRRGGHGRA